MNIKKYIKEKYTKLNDFKITNEFFNDKKVDVYMGYTGINDDEPDDILRIIFDFNLKICSDDKEIVWEYQDHIRKDMLNYIENILGYEWDDYESHNYYNSNIETHNNTEVYDVATVYTITKK